MRCFLSRGLIVIAILLAMFYLPHPLTGVFGYSLPPYQLGIYVWCCRLILLISTILACVLPTHNGTFFNVRVR